MQQVTSWRRVQFKCIPRELEKALTEQAPLRRIADLEDVAVATVFLASDQTRWVTGR